VGSGAHRRSAGQPLHLGALRLPVRARAGRPRHRTRTTDRNGNGNAQPASVPLDKGGHNFFALPKFMVRVV
jgi:hypothetical protein